MNKRHILQNSNFGERVAEEESSELAQYFVETDHWGRIFRGEVDIVYGSKGAGKSALYSLLISRTDELFDRGVILQSGEKPRGTPVFSDLRDDPPTTEEEFVGLWKLYILTLVCSSLLEYSPQSTITKKLQEHLETEGLAQPKLNLSRALGNVVKYVRSYFRPPNSVEGTIKIDTATGVPNGFGGKITFAPTDSPSNGISSVDSLLDLADSAFKEMGYTYWILLDRLDVAFADAQNLEANALRALFRVYLDLLGLEHIALKVFLRTDIWQQITQRGFREASHITRHVTIKWSEDALVNLVMRRILKNDVICQEYEVVPAQAFESLNSQQDIFYRIFPEQVDIGPNKSKTFQWILARTTDGLQERAPREIIHFLNVAREEQLRQHEIGSSSPDGESLFSRSALRAALPEVSQVRLNQTLLAEHPTLRPYIEKLRHQKTQQHPNSLSRIWECPLEDAVNTAEQLADVGFFERRSTSAGTSYRIPFLYREATQTIQGTAE